MPDEQLYVVMTQASGDASGSLPVGMIVQVTPEVAKRWVQLGIAKAVSQEKYKEQREARAKAREEAVAAEARAPSEVSMQRAFEQRMASSQLTDEQGKPLDQTASIEEVIAARERAGLDTPPEAPEQPAPPPAPPTGAQVGNAPESDDDGDDTPKARRKPR